MDRDKAITFMHDLLQNMLQKGGSDLFADSPIKLWNIYRSCSFYIICLYSRRAQLRWMYIYIYI